MSDELESATPAQVEQTEQVQAVEQQATPEATTEQTQEQAAESPEDKAKKEPWFQKRIGELTREKYEAKRMAEAAANEVAQYRDYVARLQQGDQAQPPAADVQTLVQQEAARMLAERSFNETCNKVYAAGKAEFPNFDQSVANLQLVGVGREFLELATSSDAGAKLLNHLGANLEEAERIASLSPVQMARELTRLEFKLTQPSVKPVSKAPAPISPISGTNSNSKSPDEMTDTEFAKWRKSQIAARR